MTKTLNQIILFSSIRIRIFFQQHWESEYFSEKNRSLRLTSNFTIPDFRVSHENYYSTF